MKDLEYQDLDVEDPFELVYRAIWLEDRANLTELLRSEFISWGDELRTRTTSNASGGANGASTPGGANGASTPGGANGISSAASTASIGQTRSETLADGDASAIELSLDITCEFGKTRTLLRVLSETDRSWVWVDAESTVDPDHLDTALRETIKFVSTLIGKGEKAQSKPHVGNALLFNQARALNPNQPEEIERLAKERIFSLDRKTPIVVLADDPIDGAGPTMERAGTAAQMLAGVAQVLVLPKGAITQFQKVMGDEFDVQPGEARLYMPYAPNAITRHPAFTAPQIRTNFNEVCRRLFLTLLPTLVATRPPLAFDYLQKSADTRKERDDTESTLEERLALLQEETEEVWKSFHTARLKQTQAQGRLDEARDEIADLQRELQESIEEAQTKQDQINSLQDKLVLLLENQTGEAPVATGGLESKTAPDEFTSVLQVLERANDRLKYVTIHASAGQELDRLDRSHRRDLWIRELLTALKALGAYAYNVVEGDKRYKNFQDWCLRSSHALVWPGSVKKLSMHESEEVKRRPELKEHRQMPVSTEVHPSGVIEMEAHLKLANGDTAPRLYFYDDTTGNTRMVHVGYFGPHLPTKRFGRS